MGFHHLTKTKSGFQFLPVAGASLWLDADDASSLSLNGSLVTQWVDKSGNNRYATPGGAGSEPSLHTDGLNGRDTITFGSNDGMNINYALSAAPYTLYIIYDTTGASAARRAIQGPNNWLIGPYNGYHNQYGGSFNTGPAVTQGVFAIAGTTNSSTNAYFYVNGTSYTTTNTLGVPGTSLCLGGSVGNGV